MKDKIKKDELAQKLKSLWEYAKPDNSKGPIFTLTTPPRVHNKKTLKENKNGQKDEQAIKTRG